jgi:putative oxidoreductase
MHADVGLVLIRVVVGALFIGHGLQKLTGAFGGHGIEGTAMFMESLDLRPGRRWALVAGLAESIGGLLFALGFLTPVGAVLISAVMLMAMFRVHWAHGLWVQNGGYEYLLVTVVLTVGVALIGPGSYALDTYFGLTLPVVPILVAGLALDLIVVAITLPGVERHAKTEP